MRLNKPAFALAAAALLAVVSTGFSADAADKAPDTQAKTGAVSGTVNGTDGKPAAGVIVRLLPDVKGKTANDTAADPEKKKGRLIPAGTATTDDKGEFKIDHVAAGHYVVNANVKGVGHAKAFTTVTEGQTVNVTLQLVAPGTKKKA